METKVCKTCGKELPMDNFYINRARKDNHDAYCKECRKANSKKHAIAQRGVKATFRIADFEDNMLIAELRRRGYSGELQFSKVVSI